MMKLKMMKENKENDSTFYSRTQFDIEETVRSDLIETMDESYRVLARGTSETRLVFGLY
jgi:hypothetical protein